MNTSQNSTNESPTPAVRLGLAIRQARKQRGWTIAELAEQLGRPREWLNRIELGYSQEGYHRPPSSSELKMLISLLGDSLEVTPPQLLALGQEAETQFNAWRQSSRPRRSRPSGKLTQAEIIVGEAEIGQAITNLIQEQHSEAVIRNTGVKVLDSYRNVSDEWKKYREALGEFFAKNPNALFKRVEFTASREQLDMAKQADKRLTGGRRADQVHNIRVKFHQHNPFQLHILIGQREAILALPQSSGQGGSNMAIVVRDKLFVEALREWYDEVLWEGGGHSRMLKFSDFEGSFAEIKDMYGFEDD